MDASVPIFRQTLAPLGLDVPPAGETDFESLVIKYKVQLQPGQGPTHIAGMTAMAECRAALIAAQEAACGPVWVSWACSEEGESATRVHMLAALFVAEGMGAAAVGRAFAGERAGPLLGGLAENARIPLYYVGEKGAVGYPYAPSAKDPDVIPCATGTAPCFVTRTIDVGEELKCGPDLLEDIIAAEDDPVGAVKIAIHEQDDVEIFAEHQYAVGKALCLWSDVPELLEGALRVYQGRALYDGTGRLEPEELDRLSRLYGLIVL